MSKEAYERKGAVLTYLRVSTKDQDLEPQRLAIQAAGWKVDKEFTDHAVSGRKTSRPGLDALLAYAREGDTIVIYSLSRLGRSTAHTLQAITDLATRGVTVASITENLDTSTPAGKMVVTVLAAMAEMEADLIRERTLAGLAAARASGKTGGRPRLDAAKVENYKKFKEQGLTQREAAAAAGISRTSAQRLDAST